MLNSTESLYFLFYGMICEEERHPTAPKHHQAVKDVSHLQELGKLVKTKGRIDDGAKYRKSPEMNLK